MLEYKKIDVKDKRLYAKKRETEKNHMTPKERVDTKRQCSMTLGHSCRLHKLIWWLSHERTTSKHTLALQAHLDFAKDQYAQQS